MLYYLLLISIVTWCPKVASELAAAELDWDKKKMALAFFGLGGPPTLIYAQYKYIYIYIYTHTHIHTYIHINIYDIHYQSKVFEQLDVYCFLKKSLLLMLAFIGS